MPKIVKLPMRMCIACKQMKPKKDMTRVVKNADGEIFPDPTGKAQGRGAYICGESECLKKLADKKLLNKSFSMNVAPEVYREIEGERLGEK